MMINAARRENDCWRNDEVIPLLSVVVPFFEYDAVKLVSRLCEMAAALDIPVEIVFADDGSPTHSYAQRIAGAMEMAVVPCLLLVFEKNIGRSAIRNQLARIARAQYLLFMDCDMMPDEDDFLEIYSRIAQTGEADIVYGGHTTKHALGLGPAFELHRAFTERRENLSVKRRSAQPVYHFYSCNFLVRKDVVLTVPLNEQFKGWGWEDGEWAARACKSYTLLHIDNPATHLGLQTPEKILQKYEQSLVNFSQMLQLQPEMIVKTQLYKAARLLRLLGLGPLVKKISRRGVLAEGLPLGMRITCMMWFKAALYSRLV